MLGVPKHPPVTQATTLLKIAEKKATHLEFVRNLSVWLGKNILLLKLYLSQVPNTNSIAYIYLFVKSFLQISNAHFGAWLKTVPFGSGNACYCIVIFPCDTVKSV